VRIWVALIVAPVLALTDQIIAFALVHWACANQNTWIVHLSHAAFLLILAVLAVSAWLRWRETAMSASAAEAPVQLHFLAGIATTITVLSAVAITAMWIPTWMISSCIA